MKKLLLGVLFLCSMYVSAQNTLNVHCKNGSVVSYIFSEKPVMTYITDGLHISTSKVDVDYPYSNLVKFTFSETADAIEQIKVSSTKDDGITRIYSIKGTLVKTFESNSFSLSELPKGIYIVKNNSVTYKINKR